MAQYDIVRLGADDSVVREKVMIFVVSTHAPPDFAPAGTAPGGPEPCNGFLSWLDDFSKDFRVSKAMLSGVTYAVFGCGNSDYDDDFNRAAKSLDGAMHALGTQGLHKDPCCEFLR